MEDLQREDFDADVKEQQNADEDYKKDQEGEPFENEAEQDLEVEEIKAFVKSQQKYA